MITTAQDTVWVREENGELHVLEIDELQLQLYGAFVHSGVLESYLAEDIAMALEYVLLSSMRDNQVFLRSEIDNTLARMLRDAGFPEVYQWWQQNHPASAVPKAPLVAGAPIRDIIAQQLKLAGIELERLAAKVEQSLQLLHVHSPRPNLVLEMARQFEEQNLPELPSAAQRLLHAQSAQLLTEQELYRTLPDALYRMALARIVTAGAVSRIFPRLQLTVRLTALAVERQWEPPVTEMMVYADFLELGRNLKAICAAAQELAGNLPIYLNIPDLSKFTTDYLQARWPEGKGAAMELLEAVTDGMDRKPFKLRVF